MISNPKPSQHLLPFSLKRKLSALAVQYLRKSPISSLFKALGVFVCNSYVPLTAANAEKMVRKGRDNIKVNSVLEVNHFYTKPARCVDQQELQSISPIKVEAEIVLLDIRNKNFSLRNNHLLDDGMNVIDEHSIQFNKLPIRKKVLSKAVSLEGRVAYLSNTDPSNYYHWMCRTLPLLRIYDEWHGLDAIDFFYVGQSPFCDFHRESLIRAGVPLERVIQRACTADRIIAAIINRSRHYGSAPIIEKSYIFSRNLFQEELKSNYGKERIYVARGNVQRRRLMNETEVISLLKEYGFKVVSMDGKTLQEQVKIFSNSEAIVAPHGAALTNLLFIQPKTKVIELFPYGFVNSCYYVLSNYGKADYSYLQGEEIIQTHTDPHHFDLYIDIHKLKQLCKQIFS
ncbi:hypothetical protein C7B76_05445 [filamentous cyanobacterium CCP2]|nr:hypothetical protein C7B76_05445 [filamentous cyanobacterium CCP2]